MQRQLCRLGRPKTVDGSKSHLVWYASSNWRRRGCAAVDGCQLLTILWCASRGIDNFLYRSSTSHTSLVSSGLAEFKYAFFSRTGRKTKKLRRSNLFQLTIFKHGLLEGSTILLQYSSISRTKLESFLLSELKCAISAGYDVILKNKSIRKSKKWHCATNVHGHCGMGYQRDR